MGTTRRAFLQSASAAASFIALGAQGDERDLQDEVAVPSLRILILGGTGFIGPHIVTLARERGHEITLFNRGQTNPHLFPDLEKLRGDRDPDVGDGLRELDGRTWDAVIDTSGYVPRKVAASAEALSQRCRQYVFVSSISVYADPRKLNLIESDALARLRDPRTETVNDKTYGALKALCERAAEAVSPTHTTVLRPGYIVGPRDPYDRFTYWAERVARGGEVLAPGRPDDPVQQIDARDLAAFIVHSIENRTIGRFNVVGPEGLMTIAELLHGCKATFGGNTTFTWVDGDFLSEQKVQVPIWVPPDGSYRGFGAVNNERAIDAGLTFRPLAATARDTLDWFRSQPAERRTRLENLLESETERLVLTMWHAQQRDANGA